MNKAALFVALIIIAATGFVGFRVADDTSSLTVKYEVKCNNCTVTYRDNRGNSVEVHEVQDTWTYEFVGKAGQFVYVAASNPQGEETLVTITRGGKQLIKGESQGREQTARAGSIL
jgi:hypothetical protein